MGLRSGYFLIRNKLSGIEQWPFYYVHDYWDREFRQGTAEMTYLWIKISWDLSWKDWDWGWLNNAGLKLSEDIFYTSDCWSWLWAGTSARTVNWNTYTWPLYVPRFLHSLEKPQRRWTYMVDQAKFQQRRYDFFWSKFRSPSVNSTVTLLGEVVISPLELKEKGCRPHFSVG